MANKSKFKRGEMVAVTISGKRYIGQFKGMCNEVHTTRNPATAWVAFPAPDWCGRQLEEIEIKLSRLKKV